MKSATLDQLYQHIKKQDVADTETDFQAQLQDYRASYYAGQTSRFLPMPQGVHPLGSDADSHYYQEQAYFLAVERGRAEDRDNMVLGQGINRLVSNIMQTGFVHDANTSDEALNEDLKAGWRDYAEDPKQVDHEGEKDFNQIAELALRNMIVDGDISHLITNSGALQTMECHYMRSPWSAVRMRVRQNGSDPSGIVHGVELRNGKRVGYYYTPQRVGAFAVTKYRVRRIPTHNSLGHRQVLHVYNPKRFTQRRGVTTIAPIIFPTKYHDDLQFAALVNAKRQSYYATIHEYELGSEVDISGSRMHGTQRTITRPDGTNIITESGSPGTRIYADVPGEHIKGFTPTIPPHSHFQHAELLMTIMSINLDLPMIVFFLDASKGNFSTYRGVIQQAQQRYRIFQRNLRTQLHTPTYEAHVRRRIATEPAMLRAYQRHGKQLFAHSFTPEGWAYIQPQTDAAADDLRLSRNLTSARRRAKERGYDWSVLTTEIIDDRYMLIEKSIKAAAKLNELPEAKAMEAKVNWRELAYGQPQGGVKLSLSGQIPDSEINGSSE